MSVIWHDLECGSYAEDLGLWRQLAAEHGDPILDIGAGTGRVALDLARAGHRVIALDQDETFIEELRRRAAGLEVRALVADARHFELGERCPLCVVPMQTFQLLEGTLGRLDFLRCARRHLCPGGVLAIAIAELLELYDVADGAVDPMPDLREVDGAVYSSRPTAVRVSGQAFVLERLRERVTIDGEHHAERDLVALERLSAEAAEAEAASAGFEPAGRLSVRATDDYAGSTVLVLRA